MPSRHAKLKERVRVEKCKHSREEFHEFFRLQSQEVLCLQLQSLEVGAGRWLYQWEKRLLSSTTNQSLFSFKKLLAKSMFNEAKELKLCERKRFMSFKGLMSKHDDDDDNAANVTGNVLLCFLAEEIRRKRRVNELQTRMSEQNSNVRIEDSFTRSTGYRMSEKVDSRSKKRVKALPEQESCLITLTAAKHSLCNSIK